MASKKKTAKSKLISMPEDIRDILNQSQFLKDSPKIAKKTQKRPKKELSDEEDITIIEQYQPSAIKKKKEVNTEANPDSGNKVLEHVSHQLEARKHLNEKLFNGLSEITSQIEADYNAMKENEQKLEYLIGTYIKCIQQATEAFKHKLEALKEIHSSFKKECEKMDSKQIADSEKFVNDLQYDIKKLHEKLVAETKRSGWESLRKSIFHAMQNNF